MSRPIASSVCRGGSELRRVTERPLAGQSLLAVFAHPDDESLACGGLLAWCVQRGVRVSLVCVTPGQWGGEAEGAGERRAESRRRELRAAADVLGLADVTVLGFEDGMLPWAGELADTIGEQLRTQAPDVVVTFDADGLYWHPDHIAVHTATTAAVAGAATPPALYYVTMSPDAMRGMVEAVAARVGHEAPFVVLGVTDVDAIGAQAPAPSLKVDVRAQAERKLAAIRCHQSQLAGSPFPLMTASEAESWLGTEYLRRAPVGADGDAFPDLYFTRI